VGSNNVTCAAGIKAVDAATGFGISVIDNLTDLERLVPEWEELLAAYPYSTIFSTWEWLSCWWRGFGGSESLRVLVVRDGSHTLVGLAPFMLSEARALGVRVRVLRLMGDGTHDSDNLDLPVRPACDAEFTRAILDWLNQSREWDVCQLRTLPSDSVAGHLLIAELKRKAWRVFGSTRPQSVIQLPATWDASLKMLSAKERGKVGLRARRLEKKYRFEIYKCSAQNELGPSLEALFELHRKHWELRGFPGTLHVPARRKFYYELASMLLERKRLDFWLLQADGKIVATQFGMRFRDTVFSLQEGFDPEYAPDSVGYVLRSQVLKHLISEGIRKYDFLGGTDESKTRWAASVTSYVNFEFARPHSRGAFYLSCKHGTMALKAAVRGSLPHPLLNAIRKIRQKQI
jgi:CelD/BcsL family acetyltransferase involved in cellulose biosynthesis